MSSVKPAQGLGGRLWAAGESLLVSRRLPLAAAVLAILFTLPSLGAGWMIDDYYHRAILLEDPRFGELLGRPGEMFRFFRGEPERTGRLIDIGLFPWWTDPRLKGEFLQALTVLTHRLDYAVWPDSAVLMHAQNLCWLAALVAVAAVFYRRILGVTRTAGVAALLFAVDDAHGATAGFIANRNSLVAATFGVAALVAHDRSQKDRSRLAAALAPILLLASLFSKEEGIGTCAYLGAYALFVDPAGRWRGCLALWPSLLAVLGWAVLRASWGYGVHDVGIYVDPLTETGHFLTALATRLPILLLGQWSPIPGELTAVLPPRGIAVLWWIAMVFLVLVVFAMTPILRRSLVARFWAAGMVLAGIPVCATLPMDRLLTFAGIGAFGLLAQYWAFVFGGLEGAPNIAIWRVVARALAWFFVAVHAVYAPIALPVRAANPLGPRWVERRLYVNAPLPASVAEQTVVVVNAPSVPNAGYTLLQRELDGIPVPRRMRVLAPAIPSVTIRRLDERTLAIRPQGGYLRWALDRVFRSERNELKLGEKVVLTGMTATITALTPDGRPAEATFRFDAPLESPSLYWLCFRGDRFEAFVPPRLGQEVEIPVNWRTLLDIAGKR